MIKTLPKEDLTNILIRGVNWIGDAVLTLPVISAIRNTYANAHLCLLAKPWVADLYRLCPYIDEVLLYESPGRHEGIMGKFRLVQEIKKRNFDAAILLQNAIEAALLTFLARIPLRAGYRSDGRGFLLTNPVPRTKGVRQIHQSQYYIEMFRALGGKEPTLGPYLKLTEEDKRRAEEYLENYGVKKDSSFLILVAPGATYGPAKRWPEERFAALIDKICFNFPARVVLLGSKADRVIAETIVNKNKLPIINLVGETNLRLAVSIISIGHLLITNDSGLMHIGGVLDVPTVAIFGSTDPKKTAPLGNKKKILYKEVSCSPCLKEVCPGDFACMNLISVEEVYEAIRSFLHEGR